MRKKHFVVFFNRLRYSRGFCMYNYRIYMHNFRVHVHKYIYVFACENE